MSLILPFYIITFHSIHSLAQFTSTSILVEEHQKLNSTLPRSPIALTKSSQNEPFIQKVMSHEAPVFAMVIALLIIMLCGCICFLCYKRLTIKPRNHGDSIESESENEHESTTKKTITSDHQIKKRHPDNDSDFDVLTKGAFISNAKYAVPIPELPPQDSIIQNTNAIYGINTDAMIQSPTVIVIKHNTDGNTYTLPSKSAKKQDIFDSPPSNVFIDSPDSVIMDDVHEKDSRFVFIHVSEPNTMNTFDSMIVRNGSANTSETYASEGQLNVYQHNHKRKNGRQSTKGDSVLEQLKNSGNAQLDENEFEVMGSPPLSPVTSTQQ